MALTLADTFGQDAATTRDPMSEIPLHVREAGMALERALMVLFDAYQARGATPPDDEIIMVIVEGIGPLTPAERLLLEQGWRANEPDDWRTLGPLWDKALAQLADEGWSTGAKIAVGVGAAVGIAALVWLIVWLVRR